MEVVATRQESRYLSVLVLLQTKHARLIGLPDSLLSELLHELFVDAFAVLQHIIELFSKHRRWRARSQRRSFGYPDVERALHLRP